MLRNKWIQRRWSLPCTSRDRSHNPRAYGTAYRRPSNHPPQTTACPTIAHMSLSSWLPLHRRECLPRALRHRACQVNRTALWLSLSVTFLVP